MIKLEQLNYVLLLKRCKKCLHIYLQSSFMFYVSKNFPKLCTSSYVNSSTFNEQKVTGEKKQTKNNEGCGSPWTLQHQGQWDKLCPNLSGIDSQIQDILVWIAPFNQL